MNTTEITFDKVAVSRLRDLGQHLYGDGWIRPMARDLGVHQKSVQDWSTGRNTTFSMNHWFWGKEQELRELAKLRSSIKE